MAEAVAYSQLTDSTDIRIYFMFPTDTQRQNQHEMYTIQLHTYSHIQYNESTTFLQHKHQKALPTRWKNRRALVFNIRENCTRDTRNRLNERMK